MFNFLWSKMETPAAFGPFHLAFLGAFVVITVLLLVFLRKCKDKTFRLIVGIVWGVILILEIGKEVVWAYNPDTKVWAYDWYSFPFQFCSLPFYLWPLVAFLPKSKFKTLLNLFIGTFVFFGGFGYLFVPASFCGYTFINFQTMIHHGAQVIIGIFIFVHEYEEFTYKKFLLSSSFLVGSVALAIILNVIITKTGHSCNLFELNPLIKTEAALFKDILNAVGYPLYVLIYILGFFAFGNACYFAMKGIIELIRFIKRKNEKKKIA